MSLLKQIVQTFLGSVIGVLFLAVVMVSLTAAWHAVQRLL